jgi:DNA replication and repair protein RecF
MLLEVLRLQHLRNLEFVEVEPHRRFNILAGDNGQGKTNFLEAIYLLSAVRSFRARKNAELIQFDETQTTLEARVDRGGHERIVRLEISERGKEVYLNDVKVDQLSDFFGTVNVVMFGPQDLSILKGSPSERRDFVDQAIFNAHPAYQTDLDHYDEVLDQRNALLKEPALDEALLSVYDKQLVQYGADVVARRASFLEDFAPVLESVFRDIFDADMTAGVEYDMKWADKLDIPRRPPERDVEIERALADALEQTRHKERDRGYTVIGPHRDDLFASLEGRDISTYGSQGQHRAFILAMKIAVITYLKERFHFSPILLLDDVSSELDPERNERLFEFLREQTNGQVFVTTTHPDYIPLDEDNKTFEVENGNIQNIG